jgi:hypothetical protein
VVTGHRDQRTESPLLQRRHHSPPRSFDGAPNHRSRCSIGAWRPRKDATPAGTQRHGMFDADRRNNLSRHLPRVAALWPTTRRRCCSSAGVVQPWRIVRRPQDLRAARVIGCRSSPQLSRTSRSLRANASGWPA